MFTLQAPDRVAVAGPLLAPFTLTTHMSGDKAERRVTATGKSTHKENGFRKLPFTPNRLRLATRKCSIMLCLTQSRRRSKRLLRRPQSKRLFGTSVPHLWQKSISSSTRSVHAASRSPPQPPAAEGLGRKCSWIAHWWKSHLEQQTPRSELRKAISQWFLQLGREPTARDTATAGGESWGFWVQEGPPVLQPRPPQGPSPGSRFQRPSAKVSRSGPDSAGAHGED